LFLRLIKFDIFDLYPIEFIRLKSCESFRYDEWIGVGADDDDNNWKMETDDKKEVLFCII
jgi:hypothetical protein